MKMRRQLLLLSALLGFIAAASDILAHSGPATASHPQLTITLRPASGTDGKVTGVAVDLELNGVTVEGAKVFALRIPVEFAGIKHVADRIENLQIRSPEGIITPVQVDEPPDAGGSLFWRRWEIAQPLPHQLKVHYRARLDPPHPWPGPPFDLRSNGSGVSGAGYAFLVLPDSEAQFDISLKWDLRSMAAGARAMASVGEGDVRFQASVESLQECFFMAGPLGVYPEDSQSDIFRSAWLGTPPFDAKAEMQWSDKTYLALRQFFGEHSAKPFYFFMRAGNDNESYGGAALANSFLLFAPQASDGDTDDSLRLIIAHEITHHFAGGLTSPTGIEGSWFGEGLAEYYSRLVTFRAGLISPSEFGKAINRSAQAYYTNPLKGLPNDKIAEGFWRDKNVQGLPYQRGFFYFVDTNEKLRTASQAKVSLDSVLLPLLSARSGGKELTPQMWKQAIEKQLPGSGGQAFESVILQGDLVVPASDAFGPCFERQTLSMGTYELGFDQHKTLDVEPRVVQGLVSGSAAEKAGLRNGDIVLAVDPRNADELRSDVTKRIHLRIKRGDQILEVEYLPRAQPVEGYQWVRRSNVPDDVCSAHV